MGTAAQIEMHKPGDILLLRANPQAFNSAQCAEDMPRDTAFSAFAGKPHVIWELGLELLE